MQQLQSLRHSRGSHQPHHPERHQMDQHRYLGGVAGLVDGIPDSASQCRRRRGRHRHPRSGIRCLAGTASRVHQSEFRLYPGRHGARFAVLHHFQQRGGTLAWTASRYSATWLTLDSLPPRLLPPSTFRHSGQLSAGAYNGTVTITGTGASNSPAIVTVTLVVSAAAGLSWWSHRAPPRLHYASGGAVPAAQNLSIGMEERRRHLGRLDERRLGRRLAFLRIAPRNTRRLRESAKNLPPGANNATVTIAADNIVTR